MKPHASLIIILISLLLAGVTVQAQLTGGRLDTTFNQTGKTVFNIESAPTGASFTEVAVTSGGKIVAVGRVSISGGSSNYGVGLVRFNSDGTIDPSFGSGGKVITDLGQTTEGMGLVIQSDEKIVVIGRTGTPPYDTTVLRYNTDGTLDATFSGDGVYHSVVEQPKDIALAADGKIVIAGTAGNFGSTPGVIHLSRLNTDGTLDTTFGTNGLATAGGTPWPETNKMVIQPDGKIVVSTRTSTSTVAKGRVYRFNTDGALDMTLGGTGSVDILHSQAIYLAGLAVQPDGKIVIGAFASVPQISDTELALIRLNPDGSNDGTFGGGRVFHNLTEDYDRVSDMVLQADGKILLAGHKDDVLPMVARFDSIGGLDATFGTGGVADLPSGRDASGIALHGSNFVTVGPAALTTTFMTRLNSTGTPLSTSVESFVIGKHDHARDVAIQPDGKIVAAGVSFLGGSQVVAISRLHPNGTLDPTFGIGGITTVTDGTSASEARAVEIQPDGKIIVAGRGTQQFSFTYHSLFVARLNPDGSLDNTFGVGGRVIVTSPANMIGYDMDLQPDGKIVIGGEIQRLVGDGIFNHDMFVARLAQNGALEGLMVYQFDGFQDAWALHLQSDGKILLAGTHLLRVNSNLTIDDTFSSTPISLGIRAADVKSQPDGKVVLSLVDGSDFILTRFNSNATLDMDFGINGVARLDFGIIADGAYAIYLEPNGDIVAGGFTFGAGPRFALGRFKSNGSPDPTFGSGGRVTTDFGGNAEILGLTRQRDGKIVAVGFAKVNVDQDFAIARYLSRTTPFDFDGDTKADISIFRPAGGEWWYLRSSNDGNTAFQFGSSTDKIVPADYTGDGRTDVAFFRPGTGEWFVMRSEDNTYYAHPFGLGTDIPAPGDFDNDGKADQAVFRPSNGTWYIHNSAGGTTIQQFGQNGDAPIVSDYDGDGKADIAIYRAAAGEWWIQRSTAGMIAFQFGNSADKAVPADYTGDGKTDVAFFRPSTGQWFVMRSENFSYYAVPFGLATDIPTPGDYDGDGQVDAAVFRPSTATWFVRRSTGGTTIQVFGQTGDAPVPGAYVP